MNWPSNTVASAQAWLDADDALRAIGAVDGADTAMAASTEEALGLRFGIGSVTKTMTATVLSALHLEGTTTLDTPVGRHLDAGSNGHVTLRQLATHTSGLPRLSPNAIDHDGYDAADPYASFTAELAIAGLREADLSEGGHAYSNFGYQILGLALEAAAGRPLAELYRCFVWDPLGMAGTVLRDEGTDRLAPGRHRGRPVARWRSPVPGPGGVEVAVADMVRYLAAIVEPPAGLVGDAIGLATGEDPLGWFRTPDGLLVHDGGEAGVAALALVDRTAGRAVGTLSATHPDGFGQVAVACLRGHDVPAPVNRPVDEGHPAWETFRGAASAIADKDADRLIALLAASYLEHAEAVAAISDELDELATPDANTLRALPGSPPGAIVDLSDGRELLMVTDPTSHLLAGFMPLDKDETPPW